MRLIEFTSLAMDCTNMDALDALWLSPCTTFDGIVVQTAAAQVYCECRRKLIGDGSTGEAMDNMPF